MSPSAPSRRPIAIFDSGIGGLPYLSAARAALPRESFVYAADREGFPYGSKSRAEVRGLVLGILARLVGAYSPKAIVIACNTASQAALEEARAAHPGLPIVGTVPAVKPAAERSRAGIIGIMATAGAVEDPYLDSLVARHASGLKVLREGAQDLVSFVERRSALAGPEERRAAVEPHVRRLVDGGADEIVLACTHFLHLRDEIAQAAGPGVEVVDSIAGVVARLGGLLGPGSEAAAQAGAEDGLFLLTGGQPFELEYEHHARAFGLRSPSPLPGR
jgi:glutamate racemase